MLVSADRVVTTGAAMGHLDLALWLIRKASPQLATVVSRYLLADIRSSQAPYIRRRLIKPDFLHGRNGVSSCRNDLELSETPRRLTGTPTFRSLPLNNHHSKMPRLCPGRRLPSLVSP